MLIIKTSSENLHCCNVDTNGILFCVASSVAYADGDIIKPDLREAA